MDFSGQRPTVIPGINIAGGLYGRLNAWNGFAAGDTDVYTAGMGGHTDYAGNEAYRINLLLDNPQWVMLRQPTPDPYLVRGTIGNSQPYYLLEPDGKIRPTSSHLYYALHVVGDEIIRTDAGSQWGDGNASDDKCVAYNLTQNDWRPPGTYPDSPVGPYNVMRCKDWRDGTIYYVAQTHLFSRHPTTGTWTQLGAIPENGTAAYARPGAVDTTRNRLVIFGDAYRSGGLHGGLLYDITAGGAVTRIVFGGPDAGIIDGSNESAAEYEPSIDKFILKTKAGNAVYVVDPVTFAVTAQATTGGSAIVDPMSGLHTRFVRVPGMGGCFYQPLHTHSGGPGSNAWFLATE